MEPPDDPIDPIDPITCCNLMDPGECVICYQPCAEFHALCVNHTEHACKDCVAELGGGEAAGEAPYHDYQAYFDQLPYDNKITLLRGAVLLGHPHGAGVNDMPPEGYARTNNPYLVTI